VSVVDLTGVNAVSLATAPGECLTNIQLFKYNTVILIHLHFTKEVFS